MIFMCFSMLILNLKSILSACSNFYAICILSILLKILDSVRKKLLYFISVLSLHNVILAAIYVPLHGISLFVNSDISILQEYLHSCL